MDAIDDNADPSATRFSRQSILVDGEPPRGCQNQKSGPLEAFRREFNGAKGIEFKVISSLRDVFGSRADQLGPAKGFFYPTTSEDERNTVFLVSSSLSGPRDARLTLVPKILARYGINLLPADAKRAFLEAIDASRGLPFVRRLAREVKRDHPDQDCLVQAEEILARASKAYMALLLIRRIMARLMELLRKAGSTGGHDHGRCGCADSGIHEEPADPQAAEG